MIANVKLFVPNQKTKEKLSKLLGNDYAIKKDQDNETQGESADTE